jgi:8-oxo-dGTP diphosphatase
MTRLKRMALCFLIRENLDKEVLLGYKKTGFGLGKYAGFGGKVKQGESGKEAAVRELTEETSIVVSQDALSEVGHLTFLFPHRPAWSQQVQVFLLSDWNGEPFESDEMRPKWFKLGKIPLDQMWSDASFWLPRLLSGERIHAQFIYGRDNESIEKMALEEFREAAGDGEVTL